MMWYYLCHGKKFFFCHLCAMLNGQNAIHVSSLLAVAVSRNVSGLSGNTNWSLGRTRDCCSIKRWAVIWCQAFNLVFCLISVRPWISLLRAFPKIKEPFKRDLHYSGPPHVGPPHVCFTWCSWQGFKCTVCVYPFNREMSHEYMMSADCSLCFNGFSVHSWIFRWVNKSVVKPIRDGTAKGVFRFGRHTKAIHPSL